MLDFTTAALITSLKRRGSVPTSQSLFDDDDFCDLFTQAQKKTIVPNIMKTREEFFVATYETPLLPNTIEYALPTRAIGMKVRQVILLDDANNEVRLPRIEPENKTWHENFIWWPGTKSGYLFEGNKVILTPNLNNSYRTLRIKYFRRPSELVATSHAGKITSIDTGTGVLGLTAVPSGWAAARVIDIVNGSPPFDSRADSISLSGVSGATVTVDLATAALCSIGDWVCDEGETVVPQYPEELHPALVSFALIDVLKALGDTQGASNEAASLAELMNDFNTLISNRDEGAPRKIVNRRGLWDSGGI